MWITYVGRLCACSQCKKSHVWQLAGRIVRGYHVRGKSFDKRLRKSPFQAELKPKGLCIPYYITPC